MKIWKRNYLRFIFFLCGNYGIIFFFSKLEKVTYSCEAAVAIVTIFICGLWYIFCRKRKCIYIYAAIIASLLLMVGVAGRNKIYLQLGYLQSALSDEPGLETQSITFLFVFAMLLVSGLLFVLELWWKRHDVVCLILIGILMAGPMMGIPSSYLAIFLLLLFMVSFAVIQAGRLTGVVVTGLFVLAFIIVYSGRDGLYQLAYEAEYFVNNTIRFVMGTADEATANGQIGKGNDYKTGTVQLELETGDMITEKLYLKGFSGSDYLGGSWKEDSDTGLLTQAAQTMGLGNRAWSISNRFGGMYFTLNVFLSDEGIFNSRSITMHHPSKHYRRYFSPYGGQWSSDSAYIRDLINRGYTYRYFEQKDMKIDWSVVRPGIAFENQANWYSNLQDAYMEAVEDQCLQVPKERIPRLTKLCEEHPLTELDEITAFIISALESNADYTLTPGNAPINKDIVEYFMFESGKGYCQHFASTAVLMYRLYGIPARYASGYLVDPEDFVLEKGMYRAYLTDESAHAWVEIFMKDYGWVPIDVTPSTDGNIRTSYPGFDGSKLEQVLAQYKWDADSFIPVYEAEEKKEIEEVEEEIFEIYIPWEKVKEYVPIIFTIAIYTIMLFPFLWDYRRLKRLLKLEGMDCRQLFARCMELLGFVGYLKECDGTEEDFAKRLSGVFPEIEEEDFKHMMAVVEMAAYGPKEPDDNERVFVKNIYKRMEEEVGRSLRWQRKVGFYFIKYY